MSVIDDSIDPLDKYRKIVAIAATESDISMIYRCNVGPWVRFGKTQEIRWFILGKNGPEHICAETFDLVDGVWVLKRYLNFYSHELPKLMESLLTVEREIEEISTRPKDSWTTFTVDS